MLLSDALPNIGKDPEQETLEIVSQARAQGISVSVIGRIATVGGGRFYLSQARDVDTVLLQDYQHLR